METLRTCLCLDATFPETRSYSTRRRQEIEARNVCQWLCMAGFPQYVQMFQDSCGSFNLTQVEKDHQFLDAMSLKLLLSQIAYLNQLSSHKVSIELSKEELSAGSDGEDDHVLSDQWTCQTEGGRRWVHKFLPQSRIASGHQKLSRGGSSLDGEMAASSKISNVKPLFRCLSSGPVPSAHCSNSEPLPVGDPKVRSSSLSGKGVKRSSFFAREHPNAPRLSRDSSVSDSESLSESSSVSGVDQSKFRSSFRNIFRRSGSHRGRNAAAGHGRHPNAPSVGKVDIGCPVFVGSPEIKEKMDKLHCVNINSTAIQALAAEVAESDVPVVSACNNNFGSACESGCADSCSVINGHQCIITAAHKHDSLSLSSTLENGFRESAVQNSGLKKSFEAEMPVAFNAVDNLAVRNYSARAMDANGLLCIKKVGDHSADDHLSVYDNLTDSSRDKSFANPQLELDLILAELYRNIESLNETLQDVENPYFGADSDCVFEEAATSHICDEEPPLSQHSHVSELVISIANGAVATNNCQNDVKSDCTCADADDSRHPPNADSTASGLNMGKHTDKDIPDSLPIRSNDAKNPSTVIPESVEYVKNTDGNSNGKNADGNSNGKDRDCSTDAKVNAVRLETCLQSPRWQSFSQDHRLSFSAECGNLSCMTACQMALLYKLNLIKLTSILEKYVPSVPFSWFWNKSKQVSRCQQSSGVFGRSLLNNLQEIGCPLPSWVILAMQRIRRCAAEAIGIFRKSGVRSRIQKFRDQIQSEPDSMNFESLQIYDVADLLKLYFRELPDCLLTRPLSQIFVSIFRNVPTDLQLEAVRACIVLMPDENREVLQCLLFLLLDLSAFANKNQMTASNLAICFAPSLFHCYGIREILPKLSDKPAKHKGVKGGGGEGWSQKLTPPISQNELHEQQAAQECLTFMISNAKELFSVSCDILEQCNVLQLDCLPFIHPFDKSSLEIYRAHLQLMIDDIMQESSENFKGWSPLLCINNVELSYKKQEHPLRLWRCCIEVAASPQDVLTRIQMERHLWDRDLIDECIVDRLGTSIDVRRYTFSHTPPQMPRTFCVLRSWNTKLPNDACILVSASIKHPESMAQDSICGTVFTSSYLIESLGKEKSQVIFISQVDLRGYSPRWYRKAYGYLCVNLMTSLRDSLDAHRQTKV